MIPRYIPSYSVLDLLSLAFSKWNDRNGLQSLLGSNAAVIPCASACDGLLLALRSLGIKGKVALPAYTCIKVPEAVLAAGCELVFVDVSPITGTFISESLKEFEPGDLQVIIATHMFGYPCDMRGILEEAKRINALVIEDCALSLGSKIGGRFVGSFAPISIFSFGRGKTLNLGGGGALVVNEDLMADTLVRQALEDESRVSGNKVEMILLHFRMLLLSKELWVLYFPIVSAIKRFFKGTWRWEDGMKLSCSKQVYPKSGSMIFGKLISKINVKLQLVHKQDVAGIYRSKIRGNEIIQHFHALEGAEVVCPSYPLIVEGRDALFLYLRKHGVDCGLSFSYSAATVCFKDGFLGAEALAEKIITLPVHEGVSCDKAGKVSSLVNRWVQDIK